MLDTLHYADYAPHVNTKFRLHLSPTDTVEIELAKAEEITGHPQQERFVLSFLAPPVPPIGQGLHPLEHPQLGAGGIFLVPVGLDATGLHLEAVFNRRREVAQA